MAVVPEEGGVRGLRLTFRFGGEAPGDMDDFRRRLSSSSRNRSGLPAFTACVMWSAMMCAWLVALVARLWWR